METVTTKDVKEYLEARIVELKLDKANIPKMKNKFKREASRLRLRDKIKELKYAKRLLCEGGFTKKKFHVEESIRRSEDKSSKLKKITKLPTWLSTVKKHSA